MGTSKKPYTEWVCCECGTKYGRRVDVDHISTYHVGTCGVCGSERAVTEPRDFGHLRDGWEHEPQRD